MKNIKVFEKKVKNFENFKFNKSEILGLIERVAGKKYADFFEIEQIPSQKGMDEFAISNSDDLKKVKISATSGVAAASAFRVYLEDYCNSYVGPITRRINLPENPPLLKETITRKSPFLYRYLFNYCTFGYTFAYWSYEEWESFIDWTLMSGYNLILNPIGNELVWLNTLQKLGYSLKDARNFLCSPSFYPWQCMMNIEGWGGAAFPKWYEDRAELSNKITDRLNSMGACTVLPGFAGMVPIGFEKYYPDTDILNQGGWCGMNRPGLLNYTDKMFSKVAQTYYGEMKSLLGNRSAYFSIDPFHEGGDCSKVNMEEYGKACYAEMKKANENAVWFLQGWGSNPRRSILKELNQEDVLIANLKAEINPDGGDDFAGYPWMYCHVNNFGGRRELRGNFNNQYFGPHKNIKNEDNSMVGIGILPEGVETDEILFDIFADNSFRENIIDRNKWLEHYIKVKYGYCSDNLIEAFKIMCDKVYLNDTSNTPRGSSYCAQPSLTVSMITPCCGYDKYTYNPEDLFKVAKLMLKEADKLVDCKTFRFDFCDIVRQVLSLAGWDIIKRLQTAFKERNRDNFDDTAKTLIKFFEYQILITSCDEHLSLKACYNMDKFNYSKEETEWLNIQAKMLFTHWGNSMGFLHDYSAREVCGMLEHFYLPRWQIYIEYLKLNFDLDLSDEEIDKDYRHHDMERAFCLYNKKYDEQVNSFETVLGKVDSILDESWEFICDKEIDYITVDEHAMEAH